MDVAGALLIGRNNIATLNRLEKNYSKYQIITDLNTSLFFLAIAILTIAGFFVFSIYKYKSKLKVNPV